MDTLSTVVPSTRRSQSSSILRLSTGVVQCADPDLKREALSELFDHCMTPLGSPRTLHPGTMGKARRPRPLSAAPRLNLDLSKVDLGGGSLPSGMLSPVTPANEDEAAYYSPNVEFGYEECGSADIGTFAQLRRKLYGDKQSTSL